MTKDLFTPGESEKDQRTIRKDQWINYKYERKFCFRFPFLSPVNGPQHLTDLAVFPCCKKPECVRGYIPVGFACRLYGMSSHEKAILWWLTWLCCYTWSSFIRLGPWVHVSDVNREARKMISHVCSIIFFLQVVSPCPQKLELFLIFGNSLQQFSCSHFSRNNKIIGVFLICGKYCDTTATYVLCQFAGIIIISVVSEATFCAGHCFFMRQLRHSLNSWDTSTPNDSVTIDKMGTQPILPIIDFLLVSVKKKKKIKGGDRHNGDWVFSTTKLAVIAGGLTVEAQEVLTTAVG